jgi:16S rRNA G527 N7-methylase RsmG
VAPLKLVYGILNRCANVGAVGGAIFGEITQQKFQEIINYMKEHCEFNDESLFLDVGSGMGKPNFHAAIDPGCKVIIIVVMKNFISLFCH